MNFAEVRSKYPQYQDLSDEQLGKALHAKFYSDLPYDQFAAKVGLTKQPQPNRYMEAFKGAAPYGLGAPAMAWEALQHGNEMLDKAAYSAGGAVTDVTGSPAAGTAANTAIQAVPMLLGGQAAKIGTPLLKKAGEGMMQWALKPSQVLQNTDKADRAISTLLEKGINVSKGGIEKLEKDVPPLAQKIANEIRSWGFKRVDTGDMATEADKVAARYAKGTNAEDALAAVARKKAEALRSVQGQSSIPLLQAQEAKQENYRQLGLKAYERARTGAAPSAEEEAVQAITRALRKGIEKEAPAVGPMNKEMGDIVSALRAMRPRVYQQSNAPIGWVSPLMAAHSPMSALGYEASRSPAIKSALARLLYSGELAPNAARLGIGSATIGENE